MLNSPKNTNGCSLKAMSPPLASPPTPPNSSATSSSSNCRKKARPLARVPPPATVESVKAASEVYCPLDGEIVEVNQAIVDDPSLVGSDPEGAAWFFKLKLANPADAAALLDKAAYEALIA